MAKMYRCKNCGKTVIFGDSLISHDLFKALCPKCKKMATFDSKEA